MYMFIVNHEVRRDEIDDEVTLTYDVTNKITKTISEKFSQYDSSSRKLNNIDGTFNY